MACLKPISHGQTNLFIPKNTPFIRLCLAKFSL
jgi:hypothetical protein